MQSVVQENLTSKDHNNICDDEDQEAIDLFDEIQISEDQPKESKQVLKNEKQENHQLYQTPKSQKKLKKKEKKKKNLQKISKNKRKEKKEKKKKKRQGRLKKVKRQDEDGQKNNDLDWSSSQSSVLSSDDDLSSDSLLGNLNPQKKRFIKNSSSKKTRTQKKEGFSLKELGNDGEVYLKSGSQEDESGSEYVEGKRRKKREKVQIESNIEILKNLLDKGVCVEEQDNKSQNQYDHGIDDINQIKAKKKKGVRVMNRLFSDITCQENENQQEKVSFQKIELQVKPKAPAQLSQRTCSFLKKAETLKKYRGMQAEVDKEDYEKFMKVKYKKALQDMMRSELDGVEDITLDIKVPDVMSGKSELNNALYLKNLANNKIGSQSFEKIKSSPIKTEKRNKTREQVLKSINEVVRKQKSKNITDEKLRNNFKITKLEELQETRKRLEEKRKRQALNDYGYSEQEEEQEQEKEVEGGNQNKDKESGDKNEQKLEPLLNEKKYKELLQLQEGFQMEEEQGQDEEDSENLKSESLKGISEEQGKQITKKQIQIRVDCEEIDQNEEKDEIISQNIQVRLSHKNVTDEEFNKVMDVSESQSEHDEEQKQNDNAMIDESEEKQRKQYLKELQEEGIQIKKKRQINYEVQEQNQKAQDIQQARKEFKKLRKIATIIKKKKKERERGIKMAEQFYDEEAQLGSDNEDHDDEVKKIDYDEEEKEYAGLDLDADLQELIDNAVDINEQNEEEAFRKYLEEGRMKDKEELKKIMRGQFRRKHENDEMVEEMEEHQREKRKRMDEFQQYIKKREQEQGKHLYANQEEQDSEEEGEKKYEENNDYVEMNEQNLKKYLDEGLNESKLSLAKTTFKPRKIFQSVQKTRNHLEKRNTMKMRVDDVNPKLKKTSSHINEIIMKNKPKVPTNFLRKLNIIKR